MRTTLRTVIVGSFLFSLPVLAHAQNGCVDSPECPTAVLGIVGGVAAALYTRFRSR